MRMYRSVFHVALVVVMACLLGGIGTSVLANQRPDPRIAISLKDLPVVSSHAVPYGLTVRFLPHRPTAVLVARDEAGTWRAFANRSTHLGEPVVWSERYGRFLDVYSGAMWDLQGRPVAGPAPRGLDQYKVTVEGEHLIVDLGQAIVGGKPH